MQTFSKKRLSRLTGRVCKKPAFLYEKEDESFLGRFTTSEWTEYEIWLFRNRFFSLQRLKEMYQISKNIKIKPKISVIMPVYNPNPLEFKQAIDSLLWQAYPNWELCIADDLSDSKDYLKIIGRFKDRRIKIFTLDEHSGIASASQYALEMADGEYVVLMDQDDELYPDALFSFVNVLQYQEMDYFYSDRDMISPQGKRYMHFFKPDWSPEYLLSFNYTTHLEIYDKNLILNIGGFRRDYEGSQDFDLVLRATEQTNRIYHHPMMLYSWRQSHSSLANNLELKSYVFRSGVKTVADAVKRRNLNVKEIVENPDLWHGHYKIIWDKEFFSDKKIFLITIGTDEKETKRLKQLFAGFTDSLNIDFISSDYAVENINRVLKSIHQEGYVFFCDDTITEIVSHGLIDMLGYLSIDGVDAVGCKFLDINNNIFNVGLSVTASGRIIFNFRGSPCSEKGYGAAASVPRNVSAVYPAFWGCRVSTLKERNYFKNTDNYFQASMDFFMETIKQKQRLVCVPYMSLRVDSNRYDYSDNLKLFSEKWLYEGLRDSYYNQNLTEMHEDFGIKI